MEIRWIQRYQNYQRALLQLSRAVKLSQERPLSELERQGLIQSFEYTHELAWNLLKDYLEYQGIQNIIGSRDTIREAFQRGLISHADIWMEMIKSRNVTTHTYDEKIAVQISEKICNEYLMLYSELDTNMAKYLDK